MSNANTPLHLAVQNGNIEIVKTLLARGYNLNARNVDGLTPLDLAIATNNTAIAQLLLEHENRVHTANKDGQAIPSSTGIVNKLFMLWKDGAVMMNAIAVVLFIVVYILWVSNLPADTTLYEAHTTGIEDYRNYFMVIFVFGLANLIAPFLHLVD